MVSTFWWSFVARFLLLLRRHRKIRSNARMRAASVRARHPRALLDWFFNNLSGLCLATFLPFNVLEPNANLGVPVNRRTYVSDSYVRL